MQKATASLSSSWRRSISASLQSVRNSRTSTSSTTAATSAASSSSRTFSTTTTTTSATNTILIPKNAKDVHLVILVHGWMGRPSELAYIQQAMERQVAAQHQQKNNDTNNSNEQVFVIYSATANDEQTSDGIAAGGKRLAKEVNQLVDSIQTQQQQQQQQQQQEAESNDASSSRTTTSLSLSFIGNSLGGLYARYALAEIPSIQQCNSSSSSSSLMVRPAVFCTIATPHLGVSSVDGHTYIPNIPRALEYVMAYSIQPMGQDLFRFTSVIADLALLEKFMKPLAAFEHRILYANAFGTDFIVPMTTAAILTRSTEDPSIHYSSHRRNENASTTTSSIEVDETTEAMTEKQYSSEYSFHKHTHQTLLESLSPAWIPLVVETPRQEQLWQQEPDGTSNSSTNDDDNVNDNAVVPTSTQLAQRLDSLGWVKVICDVRGSLPSIPIPSFLASSLLSSWGKNSKKDDSSQESLQRFDKQSYTSNELLELTATTIAPPLSSLSLSEADNVGGSSSNGNNRNNSHRWHLPAGHVVICANSKNETYSRFTAAGRPLMDELAARILSAILSFQKQQQQQQE